MGKQKFQCKVCGALIVGGHARREHCQIHHPAVPFGKLDIFFRMEYKEISDETFDQLNAPTPVRTTKAPQFTPLKTQLSAKQSIFKSLGFDKDIREALSGSDNIFITGKAGTGKTTLLKKIVKTFESHGRLVVVVAPTGVAAKNAGGVTIHSLLRLPISPYVPNVKMKDLYSLKEENIVTIKNIDTIPVG